MYEPSDIDQVITDRLVGNEADQNAGLELLEARFKRPLFSCFTKWGFGEADCHDLTQSTVEVVVRAVRLGKFKPNLAKLSTWVFGIATNLARNSARKASRLTSLEAATEEETGLIKQALTACVSADQIEQINGRELRDCLLEFLDSLPPRQLQVLRNRLSGKSTLGLSSGMVKGALQQVRKKLRATLKRKLGIVI